MSIFTPYTPNSFDMSLLDLFFPKLCAACDNTVHPLENCLCTKCRHALPMTVHHLNPDNEARAKFTGKLDVVYAGTCFYFHKSGIAQHLIHKLKYKGKQDIGSTLGFIYTENIRQIEVLRNVAAVIPVPLHPKRLKARGYNQVETFASAIADGLQVPLEKNLLVRTVYTKTQTKKDRLGRSQNTQSVFDIVDNGHFAGKHLLLVDDVLTTGATLSDCGKALQKIPGVKISVLCIAYTDS